MAHACHRHRASGRANDRTNTQQREGSSSSGMEPEPQPQEEGILPEVAVQQAQEHQWRETRYGRWRCILQSEPGLGLALLRLALASLMHPRLAGDAPEGVTCLPTDVIGAVGEVVFIGEEEKQQIEMFKVKKLIQ